MAIMPKKMQVLKLKDELKRKGISPDVVDLHALVDGKLSYPENLTNIMKKVSSNKKHILKTSKTASHRKAMKQLDSLELQFEKDQALDRHMRRSHRSQALDESKKAKVVIKDKDIINNPNLLKKWFNNPNRYDIQGIDTR